MTARDFGELWRRHPIFKRDPEVVGDDLVIDPLQDLVVTDTGDLQTITGADSITASLLRRLYTPAEGFRRLQRTPLGVSYLDAEYTNEAYNYLSAPLSDANFKEIRAALLQSAKADQRIEVLQFEILMGPGQTSIQGRVTLMMSYRIKGTGELKTLNYTLSSMFS
jgi:hypothetical protein